MRRPARCRASARPWTPSPGAWGCAARAGTSPTGWTPPGTSPAPTTCRSWPGRCCVTPDGHRHTLSAHSNFLRDYPGAVGVKTGFTDGAGRCLAAAATRGGRTLIAVVLHSPDPPGDAAQMMNWGFGAGRAARSGLRLPPYTPPADVAALLLLPRPPAAVAQASPAGVAGGPSAGAAAGRQRTPVTVALTSAVVLLVGSGSVATALRRRRRASP